MERKEFLKRCVALTAGLACMDLALIGCAPLPFVEYMMEGEQAVVKKADFGEEGFVLLEIETLPAPVYVTQVEPDAYAAVLLRCTHRGCKVQPAGDILECPCHGSRYSTTGTRIKGPAPRNLRRYSITTDAEHVRIALS